MKCQTCAENTPMQMAKQSLWRNISLR